MRAFFLVLVGLLTCTQMVQATGADTLPALKRSQDGSLILPGPENRAAMADKTDTLHTLLSREVEVYIFRSRTMVWPQPYTLGRALFPRPSRSASYLTGPYLETIIQKHASQYGVDPALVRAVMRHESGFNPFAVSPKGAQGLMQLMPGTAALMGVQNPFDPEQNIAGGVRYLRYCLDRFSHNIPLAVAAYNAGPDRVVRSGGIPAIPETQSFVSNVLASYQGNLSSPSPAAFLQTGKTVTKPINTKVLPTAPKTPLAKTGSNQGESRPRPKIIEVRYPKRVLAAKPKDAD